MRPGVTSGVFVLGERIWSGAECGTSKRSCAAARDSDYARKYPALHQGFSSTRSRTRWRRKWRGVARLRRLQNMQQINFYRQRAAINVRGGDIRQREVSI